MIGLVISVETVSIMTLDAAYTHGYQWSLMSHKDLPRLL